MTEITKEVAKAILKSRKLVTSEENYKCKVRISQEAYPWENGNGMYKIANTNLMTNAQRLKAIAHFKAGEYSEATNLGLSTRVSIENATAMLAGGVASIELIDTKDGGKDFRITALAPMASISATRIDMSDFEEDVISSPTEEEIAAEAAAKAKVVV